MTEPIRSGPPQSTPSTIPVPPIPSDVISDVGAAPSGVSSRITDDASTKGETNERKSSPPAEETPGSTVAGVTGPVGEPALPPSRPSSMNTGTSGNRRSQMGPPSSRRGMLPFQSTQRPLSTSGSSYRPMSSGSRTHVPSLTSSAFYRPMSSQRLQAQRGQRPNSLLGDGANQRQELQNASDINRQSFGSHTTQGIHLEKDEEPPPSRGTEYTEQTEPDRPDWSTMPSMPTAAATIRSRGESDAPLQSSPNKVPAPMNLQSSSSKDYAAFMQPQKSPRSFRSSFILQGGFGNDGARRSQGHEKLSSTVSSPRMDPKKPMDEKKAELGKNWEYFTGNTVFWWGGRMQNARDKPVNIITGIVALVPGALFFAYSGPWLWLNVSPAIPIVFAYLFLICISSYVHASVTNPGILPRNLHPFPPTPDNADPLAVGPPTTEWLLVSSAYQKDAAMEVPVKYCKSCNMWRPPRCHHCRVCDNCIETQDHHCLWLNNCIGRRNYRYFFSFILTATIMGLFLLGASLAHILLYMNREHISFGDSINRWRVPFAMAIYAVIVTSYPAALVGYHLMLMTRSETTREYLNGLKFMKKDRHRPFNQGSFWKNILVVLLRQRPPAYLHFKRKYEEGDQRFGETRGKRTTELAEMQKGGGGLEMQSLGGNKLRKERGFQGPSARGPINRTPRN
ncbi:MAG: Eukaryotic peptide chain release factor GTP-binding subunit [Bogoriella megaspora]|nr:MAG: Eukaryotic peptide chain release factor GTP-binding subunit [Bogoriella megaspora]